MTLALIGLDLSRRKCIYPISLQTSQPGESAWGMPCNTALTKSSKFSDTKFSGACGVCSRCWQLPLLHQPLFLLLPSFHDLFPCMIKKCHTEKFIASLGRETEMSSVVCSAMNPYL